IGDPGDNWVKCDTSFFVFLAYDSPSDFRGAWNGGVSDAFAGLKLNLNDSTYYGWVRCSVTSDATHLIIKDYAYETNAFTHIHSGDTGSGTGITQLNSSHDFSITVSPNPITETANIYF